MRKVKEKQLVCLGELRTFPNERPDQIVTISSLTLDCTHRCCFRCQGCIESSAMRGSSWTSLRLETVYELINEFAKQGGTEILLHGGEPTIHEHFPTIMEFAAERVNYVRLITNGSQLCRIKVATAIRRAAESANVEVRVSVNAGTEKTHEQLHGVKGFFNRIVDGMKQLTKDASKVDMGLSFLAQGSNADEVTQAYEIATDVKAAYFAIRPMTGLHGIEITQMSRVARNVILQAVQSLRENQARLQAPELRVDSYYLDFLRSGRQPDTTKPYSGCFYCGNSRIVVSPPDPGVVWACPYWRGEARFKIADLAVIPYGSQQFEQHRLEAIRRVHPGTDCSSVICNRHEANKKIWAKHCPQERTSRALTVPSHKAAGRKEGKAQFVPA